MPELPDLVQKRFEEIKKEASSYVEVKVIDGKYYLYRSTSIWDRKEKKVRKKTEYMGKITSAGEFIEKSSRKRIGETKREIFEYGNCNLVYEFLKDVEPILKDSTPYFEEILASAIIKAIDPQPIRLYASRWEKFYSSNFIDARLSPKYVSSAFRALGENVSLWDKLFSSITDEGDILLYDLSTVFTYSKQIKLAEKGYNPKNMYIDQLGVVMAFSTTDSLPVGIEVFYGSMKDITTLKDFIERYQYSDIALIFDRGLFSYPLLEDLKEEKIHFIVPLRKNSNHIDLRWLRWKKPFVYRKRNIRWCRRKCKIGYVYHFEDPKIRGEEESALLNNVRKGKISMNEFEEKRKSAGIISIMTDIDKDGKEVFEMYKGREDVELAFDAMKNTLDSDKTYLRSAEAVRGYFFVTLLAMRVYFKVLRRLREKDLTQKISVKEVLFELSNISKIREQNGREYFAKIPKRGKRILSIFPEARPMG